LRDEHNVRLYWNSAAPFLYIYHGPNNYKEPEP
jgi:hypothetical protein